MKTQFFLVTGFLAVFALSAPAADVRHNWTTQCVKCHGSDGKGNTPMGRKLHIRDLTDPKVQATLNTAKMRDAIKNGIMKNGKTEMKAYGSLLSDAEIEALVSHVRQLR